uniref:Myb-like protein X-like n=1 Tax=Saccoglossus kowalevskii TaxID=10224 RepID=A0ABM0MNJ1_SACKO|nr:PREDICTED: myb-like protein X-like [Saccoglossus kowalevskii]
MENIWDEKLSSYEILGLSPNASEDEVRKAYKLKALEVHPDKNLGDDEATKRFQELSFAYNTIIDDVEDNIDEYFDNDINDLTDDEFCEILFYFVLHEELLRNGDDTFINPGFNIDLEKEEFYRQLLQKRKKNERREEPDFTEEELLKLHGHSVGDDKKNTKSRKRKSKKKQPVPVTKPKSLSKKQLLKEQRRREKEINEISKELNTRDGSELEPKENCRMRIDKLVFRSLGRTDEDEIKRQKQEKEREEERLNKLLLENEKRQGKKRKKSKEKKKLPLFDDEEPDTVPVNSLFKPIIDQDEQPIIKHDKQTSYQSTYITSDELRRKANKSAEELKESRETDLEKFLSKVKSVKSKKHQKPERETQKNKKGKVTESGRDAALLQKHLFQFEELMKVQPKRHTEKQIKEMKEKKTLNEMKKYDDDLMRMRHLGQVFNEDLRNAKIKELQEKERERNQKEWNDIIQLSKRAKKETTCCDNIESIWDIPSHMKTQESNKSQKMNQAQKTSTRKKKAKSSRKQSVMNGPSFFTSSCDNTKITPPCISKPYAEIAKPPKYNAWNQRQMIRKLQPSTAAEEQHMLQKALELSRQDNFSASHIEDDNLLQEALAESRKSISRSVRCNEPCRSNIDPISVYDNSDVNKLYGQSANGMLDDRNNSNINIDDLIYWDIENEEISSRSETLVLDCCDNAETYNKQRNMDLTSEQQILGGAISSKCSSDVPVSTHTTLASSLSAQEVEKPLISNINPTRRHIQAEEETMCDESVKKFVSCFNKLDLSSRKCNSEQNNDLISGRNAGSINNIPIKSSGNGKIFGNNDLLRNIAMTTNDSEKMNETKQTKIYDDKVDRVNTACISSDLRRLQHFGLKNTINGETLYNETSTLADTNDRSIGMAVTTNSSSNNIGKNTDVFASPEIENGAGFSVNTQNALVSSSTRRADLNFTTEKSDSKTSSNNNLIGLATNGINDSIRQFGDELHFPVTNEWANSHLPNWWNLPMFPPITGTVPLIPYTPFNYPPNPTVFSDIVETRATEAESNGVQKKNVSDIGFTEVPKSHYDESGQQRLQNKSTHSLTIDKPVLQPIKQPTCSISIDESVSPMVVLKAQHNNPAIDTGKHLEDKSNQTTYSVTDLPTSDTSPIEEIKSEVATKNPVFAYSLKQKLKTVPDKQLNKDLGSNVVYRRLPKLYKDACHQEQINRAKDIKSIDVTSSNSPSKSSNSCNDNRMKYECPKSEETTLHHQIFKDKRFEYENLHMRGGDGDATEQTPPKIFENLKNSRIGYEERLANGRDTNVQNSFNELKSSSEVLVEHQKKHNPGSDDDDDDDDLYHAHYAHRPV